MSAEELRVGDAERDEVATALHEHFAQGRLTRDELDERLTTTLSARTVGDLRAVTRDLPGALSATGAGADEAWEWGGPPWARGGRGYAWAPGRGGRHPHHGWPPRGRPFGPLLLVAVVVAAFTGAWWMLFPLLGFLWLGVAVRGFRYARRLPHPSRR
jgi:hypothetical protein